MDQRSGSRPMGREDVESVCRLFLRVFKDRDEAPSEDLKRYWTQLFFDAPSANGANGGLVHETAGRIDAALALMPLQMQICDRQVEAHQLVAFMADPAASREGGKLALHVRARNQDFAYSDTAGAVSVDVARAMGGILLPLHSLEWLRVFSPAGTGWAMATRRRPWLNRVPLGLAARLSDRVARRMLPPLPPVDPRLTDRPMTREAFLEAAPEMVRHYAIRPVWSPRELGWLLDVAAQNTREGSLHIREIVDSAERVVGAYVYYGEPGRVAHVLNILSREGREADVVPMMIRGLSDAGCVAARGRTMPRQIEWMCRVPGVLFRHTSYTHVLTRHADAAEALRRGDAYLGGLAGETWSRLIGDHF